MKPDLYSSQQFFKSYVGNFTFKIIACITLLNFSVAKAQVNFGASAAFSLRKINPAYTGSALQVRRSSDNVTQDIGFTACAVLDTVALKTFIGANSGFVSAWYDQSGNSRDAVQATAASQPRIVNAGAIDYANGRPAVVWPGASSSGIYLAYGTNINIRTVNAVRDFKLNPFASSANNMQYLFSSPANSDYSVRLNSSGVFSYDGDNNGNDWINGSGTPKLCWVNGTQTTTPQYNLHTVTASGAGTVNGSFSIGTTFLNRNLFGNDAVSELVVYSNILSATQRKLIETSEAVHYTLTVSSSKYTPPSPFSYNLYVNGIGRESSTDSIAATRSSAGMGFKIGNTATDFLKDDGDYITAGMNCPVAATISIADISLPVLQRWANDWYVNKTDVGNNNGTLSFYFDFGDYGIAATPGVAANYELLARSSTAASFAVIPGTTKTLSGNRVLFSVDASNITTNYYYTIGTTNTVSSILPIELKSFQCQASDHRNVLLTWATASEFNNDYFLLERSADGVNYTAIGSVKSAGNTMVGENYKFEDLNPASDISYYRLKQVDVNGAFKTFNPCVVAQPRHADFSAFPNPANEQLEISAENVSGGMQLASLIQASGKMLFQKQFSKTTSIDTSELPEGFYILKIEDAGSAVFKKLVIRH